MTSWGQVCACANPGKVVYKTLKGKWYERYADRWDWDLLGFNEGLPWSGLCSTAMPTDGRGAALAEMKGLPWSEALIERYADRWNWGEYGLSSNKGLPWSEALIERYADRWDWDWLSKNEALPWSLAFIERFEDKLDWSSLIGNKRVYAGLAPHITTEVIHRVFADA